MEIQDSLDNKEAGHLPLFITGHSLGGALATVAAKKLANPAGIAACYTFGSPRVGDEEWISSIKTPIYRIVNAADCVTMLPPGTEIVTVLSWIIGFVPWCGPHLKKRLAIFGGYIHCGNMRYLTNCRNGELNKARLLYSVSLTYRIKGLIFKKLPFRKFLADHSITVYRKKLSFIAQRRNPYNEFQTARNPSESPRNSSPNGVGHAPDSESTG
jgi:triacylglycerol lipase